ncbi:MAG: hypothetical protein IPM79_24960 [Polyangiaceae bacterium]|jgi:hypothetical protein|nr:hypothetical protein [Polyangiaceae bacterium]MBK8940777.1 hypothetical protein [Polyangiaceae bacterium]
MATVPVSIETDVTYGGTFHNIVFAFIDLWDGTAPMNHPPGAAYGKHKLTPKVLHKAKMLVQDGHDEGPNLPHSPVSYFLHLLRSSRKNIYSASTVRAQNRALACVDDFHQMMVCGDPISLPSGFNASNSLHTVQIGMTAADELAGDVSKWGSVAIDVVGFMTSGGAEAFAGVAMGLVGLDFQKAGRLAALSVVTSTITSASNDWKTPITVKGELGPPQLTQEVEISWVPDSGKVHAKAEGTPLGMRGEQEWGKPL